MKRFFCLILCFASVVAHSGGMIKEVVPAPVEPIAIYSKSNASQANHRLYASIGIMQSSLQSFIYSKERVAGVSLKAGMDVFDNLSIEFISAKGIANGDALSHPFSYGLYLKPHLSIDTSWEAYVLAGYAKSRIELRKELALQRSVKERTTQSGFSFGAGVAYKIDERYEIYVEWIRFIDKETTQPQGVYAIDVSGFVAGVQVRF